MEKMVPADDDEYEVLPHKLLAELKNEVELLKKKLVQPDVKAQELILEIESMKDSITELRSVFQQALEETKKEEDVSQVLSTMKEKMDAVITQNETIARGMVAISDKLEDFMKNAPAGALPPRMTMPAMGMPMPAMLSGAPPGSAPFGSGSSRVAPYPDLPPMDDDDGGDGDLPPPPPGKKKRAGLFS